MYNLYIYIYIYIYIHTLGHSSKIDDPMSLFRNPEPNKQQTLNLKPDNLEPLDSAGPRWPLTWTLRLDSRLVPRGLELLFRV